jgi:hypothetical protein
MPVSLDFTITVPPHLFNNDPIPQGASSRQIGTALSTISSIGQADQSSRNNVTRFFGDCTICQKIAEVWKQFSDWISSCFTKIRDSIFGAPVKPYPLINQNLSADALNRIYWGLGRENKWMECIDGRYHHLGTKYVFDRGLHRGTTEPGFIQSMERSFEFAQNYLNQRVDANWYLQLHRHTCSHFNGDTTVFLMGQEKVGVFRSDDGHDGICCALCPPDYTTTPEARAEFAALDQDLRREFGETYGLGTMTYNEVTQRCDVSYKTMSRAQITRIFNKFLTEFYQEVDRTATPDQKLWAIARLQQRLEWLHPVKDGTARTSTVLMNKNLTDFGFHPAILEYPHRSSSLSLAQWKQYLQDGLLKWEELKKRFNP